MDRGPNRVGHLTDRARRHEHPGPSPSSRGAASSVTRSVRLEAPADERLEVGGVAEAELAFDEEAALALGGHVGADDDLAADDRLAAVAEARAAVVDRDEVHTDAAAGVGLPRRVGLDAVVEVAVERHEGRVIAEAEVDARDEVELRGDVTPLQVAAEDDLVGTGTEAQVRAPRGERLGGTSRRRND